jgi:CRP-like cAMP-binding protein
LFLHLEEVIDATYYPENKILYEPDEIIKEIFFLASGTAIAYTYTERGEKQLLNIYQQNDFIAGQSFTQQTKSPYT